MSGESKQTQTQNSTTAPWAAAEPALQGILGQIGTGLAHTGLTGAENNALNTTQANAANFADRFAPILTNNSTELLNGGGALNQAGAINQNYKDYYNATNPLASNTNYDPNQNPGTAALLAQIQGDVANSVNGQFAAAGRDFSGANQQAYGRGIAQGAAPVLFSQYNANRDAQQGAASNLLNAGNTNAGLLAGLQQQALGNKQAGVGAATQALDAQNAGANATLQAEAQRRGIPVQALGLLAQIGIPIAGLGSQSQGTSNTTNQASLAQQIGQIGAGFGGIFGNFGVGKAFPSIFGKG